jgi:hypothetical protein
LASILAFISASMALRNSMFSISVGWHCKIDLWSNTRSLRSNPYHFWHQLSHVWVTTDGVWIGNWIY